MSKLPPSSPMSHKVVVGTLATVIGAYAFYQTAKDFQFVKFTPRLPEEVEMRKREKVGTTITQLDVRTLEYTPEAQERLRQSMQKLQDEKK